MFWLIIYYHYQSNYNTKTNMAMWPVEDAVDVDKDWKFQRRT